MGSAVKWDLLLYISMLIYSIPPLHSCVGIYSCVRISQFSLFLRVAFKIAVKATVMGNGLAAIQEMEEGSQMAMKSHIHLKSKPFI